MAAISTSSVPSTHCSSHTSPPPRSITLPRRALTCHERIPRPSAITRHGGNKHVLCALHPPVEAPPIVVHLAGGGGGQGERPVGGGLVGVENIIRLTRALHPPVEAPPIVVHLAVGRWMGTANGT
ncbi:unnamed protein product [Closterium sp. NIES-54]